MITSVNKSVYDIDSNDIYEWYNISTRDNVRYNLHTKMGHREDTGSAEKNKKTPTHNNRYLIRLKNNKPKKTIEKLVKQVCKNNTLINTSRYVVYEKEIESTNRLIDQYNHLVKRPVVQDKYNIRSSSHVNTRNHTYSSGFYHHHNRSVDPSASSTTGGKGNQREKRGKTSSKSDGLEILVDIRDAFDEYNDADRMYTSRLNRIARDVSKIVINGGQM